MTTYKIKKEFTPMDFYDYVKSCGRETCEEFRKDFSTFVRFAGNVFLIYKPTDSVDKLSLSDMLSERANFRKYMIEGGFVEEEKPKVEIKYYMREDVDYYYVETPEYLIMKLPKDGSGAKLYLSINPKCGIQTDSEGRIKIL